jgi:WD40 repeat protein
MREDEGKIAYEVRSLDCFVADEIDESLLLALLWMCVSSRDQYLYAGICSLELIWFVMSQQLEYQECYHKHGHESVIKAMVLSPDGHRLVTGSNNSTVIMWSTQSGTTLCHIKAHSPVRSLAWLRNSKGFIFGCKNGMLASVIITKVCNQSDSEPEARFRKVLRLLTAVH